jgi:Zn-dependent peptidase ImmA (M78 family)
MKEDISQKAYEVLGENPTLPIPVESIVAKKSVRLLPFDLGENISGILVIEKGEATIGYNKNEHRVRNRFTIAHELGHFILHKEKDLFVDKEFKVMFRGAINNNQNYKEEMEANEFAANLLMPEKLLKEEVMKMDLDFTDEAAIKHLAKKFDVSTTAMSFRIANLQLF